MGLVGWASNYASPGLLFWVAEGPAPRHLQGRHAGGYKSSLKAVSQHVQIRAFVYHAALCDGHWLGGFVRICVHSLRNLCGYMWAVVMLNAL